MKTHLRLGMILCLALLAPAAARADVKYFPDTAYKRLNADDPQPQQDMLDLATQGDTRAMFILGDMYEKGKGGLLKDIKQSRHWFEESAMHGYNQSFIRLAAIAKHDNNPKEAWQWYTLAINGFDSGDAQDYAIRARKELVDSAKLSSEDTDQGRKAIDEWKDARDKHLRDEKDQAEKDAVAKEAADKAAKEAAEKAEKEEAAADAKEQADVKQPDQQENDNEQN